MTGGREREFEEFVRASRASLLRTATALTGDTHLAEDLVQGALVKVYKRWTKVQSAGALAYTRRAVVNGLIDHKRRSSTRRELIADDVPDHEEPWPALTSVSSERLLHVLGQLPPGMRSAVVLRHVEGLSMEETAEALGCSVGSAKSQSSRGLTKLRTLYSDALSTGAPSCPT